MANTTWREHLIDAMRVIKDEGPVVAWAPAEALFDVEFDDGYGGADGPAVLAWTERYVYFPVQYDGSEYLGSAPRNPQPEGQSHEGWPLT
jgi:hypothetical protein